MANDALYIIIFLVLGASIGSFLNAQMWRRRNPIFKQFNRSRCLHCQKKIPQKHLIPILSYLALQAKSACCNKKIPPQYLYVEVLMSIAFVTGYLYFGPNVSLLTWYCVAVSFLILVAVYDYLYMEIPYIWAGIGSIAVGVVQIFTGASPMSLLYAMLFGGGFFLLQYMISKAKWVGSGDIGMGILMGAILGWPVVVVGVFLSYMIGSLHVILLLLAKKKTFGQAVPFGGYLATGCVVAIFFGQFIIDWYISLLLI